MRFGEFPMSLAGKDLGASKEFIETHGFSMFLGTAHSTGSS
jgi:hypothetical protein